MIIALVTKFHLNPSPLHKGALLPQLDELFESLLVAICYCAAHCLT